MIKQLLEEIAFANEGGVASPAEVDSPHALNVMDTVKAVHEEGESYAPRTRYDHMSKVRSTMNSLVRDWSVEGAAEREESYGPLLSELSRLLPVTQQNRNRQRVHETRLGEAGYLAT